MSNDAVIEFENVTFSYDGPPVLEDVNIALEEKDFVSIVGPNGGGKTTLLKLMLGLLKPSRGEIRIFGKPPEEARPRIGYMPQDVQLDPKFPVTVMDVVLMGRLSNRKRLGFSHGSGKKAAQKALGDVGMSNFASKPLSALSGGQKRRVLIARALSSEPDLLLLDEPTSNLDLLVEQELYALLQELNEKLTVAMVSHDFAFVSKFVKSVVCVKRTVVVHPTAEINGKMFSKMFGGDIRMILHGDHLRRRN